MDLLSVDEIQARAILELQLRRLAALERQKIHDEAEELERKIADFQDILASETRQRTIIGDELAEIVDRFGDDRRSEIMLGYDGDMSIEDLIPEEEMVVTITRGGYVKRTRSDNYRSQHRGGAGAVKARAGSRVSDDIVTSTSSSPRPTTGCCSSRTRAACTAPRRTSCRRRAATPRASTSPTCSPMQPGRADPAGARHPDYERRAVPRARDRAGVVKKTALPSTTRTAPAASSRSTCARRQARPGAARRRDRRPAPRVEARHVRSALTATNDTLRPMGRSTSGVKGMSFRR